MEISLVRCFCDPATKSIPMLLMIWTEPHDDVIKWKHFPRYWPFSPFPVEFPAQRPVTRSFDVFVDLRPNKRLNKQWWGWWLETLSRSLWRHCNAHAVPFVTYLYFGPLFNHSNRDITSSSWADRVVVPERKYVIKIRVRYQYSRWRRKQLLKNVYTAIFIFCMVVFHSTEARYSGAIVTSVWYANLWQNLTKLP